MEKTKSPWFLRVVQGVFIGNGALSGFSLPDLIYIGTLLKLINYIIAF